MATIAVPDNARFVDHSQKLAEVLDTEGFFENNFEYPSDFLSLWRTNKRVAAVCCQRENILYRLDACLEHRLAKGMGWASLVDMTNETLSVGEPALFWAIRTNSSSVFERALHASKVHCPGLLQGDSQCVVPRYQSGNIVFMKSPLQFTVLQGRLDMARMLVESGAELNTCWEPLGRGPRRHSNIHTHPDLPMTSKNRFGNCGMRGECMTALHFAICEGHDDVARFLLDNHAILRANNYAPSALHLAARYKRINMMLYILDNDKSGQARHLLESSQPSPLHYACTAIGDNNLEMIDILLGHHPRQNQLRANIDGAFSPWQLHSTPLDATIPMFDGQGRVGSNYGRMARRLALAGAVSWTTPYNSAGSTLRRAILAKWANPLEINEALLVGAKFHFSMVQERSRRQREKTKFCKELMDIICSLSLRAEIDRPWDPNSHKRSPAFIVELVKLIHLTWSNFQRPQRLQVKLDQAIQAYSSMYQPRATRLSPSPPPRWIYPGMSNTAILRDLESGAIEFSDAEDLEDPGELESSESSTENDDSEENDSDDDEEDSEDEEEDSDDV